MEEEEWYRQQKRQERMVFIPDLIKAAAVPLGVGVVVALLLLYESYPGLLIAALESIRRVIQ